MSRGFEIDDEYCREAAINTIAEEEEIELGNHPMQVHEKIRKYLDEYDLPAYPFTYELKGDHLAYVEVFRKLDDETYGWEYYGIFDYIKCEFVQEDLSIKEIMEIFNIEDNPFDVIAYTAMEIMRNSMFSSRRYRNEFVNESLWNGYKSYEECIKTIESQYDILDKVNEKTIKFLREYSYFGYDYNRFKPVNDYILNLEKELNIKNSHVNPFRDLEYEKVRLGEDSKEYQRLIFLINLTDRLVLSIDYLSKMIDLINNGEQVLEYGWVTTDNYNYMKSIIDDNHLSCQDIEYMISYLKKKEKGFSANS